MLSLPSIAQTRSPTTTATHAPKPGATPKTVNEYADIDKKALHMPDSSTATTTGIAAYINANFNRSGEKARAAWIWIATNIQYDIANMFAINFYEKKEEKIAKPLQTRKGICENYAALFNDICAKTGVPSFVVEGYTKQNGFADYIPHAWCAAYIDTAWFLFDPTWGSGYVNNGKFYNKINNDYYRVRPAVFIRSHMPFDYLWQFLNYPVSNQEFYEGRTEQNKSKPFFSYPDSISAYEKLGEMEAYAAAAGRIEKNGVKNSMIFDRLQHLRSEIEVGRQNRVISLYNSAIADFNRSISSFNVFIDYHNKQFMPMKPDPGIQAMLD
ncbi:MAG TPA: transglutaminase domain-containing protein, partial [Puia sp.]|nr:transglutaminase domain-containing protein [Puia sp.]